MKRFKQHITEEWVTDVQFGINKYSDVFKNPTSREMTDFLKNLTNDANIAGIHHKNDIYIFEGNHADVITKLDLPRDPRNSFRWRATHHNGKMIFLELSGAYSYTEYAEKPLVRQKMVERLAGVYNHKSLKRFWGPSKQVFQWTSSMAYLIDKDQWEVEAKQAGIKL